MMMMFKSPKFLLAPKSLRQLADGLSDNQYFKEPPLGGRGQKNSSCDSHFYLKYSEVFYSEINVPVINKITGIIALILLIFDPRSC